MATILDIESLTIPSARGRKPAALALSVVRELGEGDLSTLLAPEALGSETRPLARLRHTHHLLARCLAEGKSAAESSVITGYSPSRISILKNDPAFKELLAYYAENVEAKFEDFNERLAAFGLSCLEELQERLESEPDKFTKEELRKLMEAALDRSGKVKVPNKPGAPGATAPVSVNLTFVAPPALPESAPAAPMLELKPE